MASLVTVRSFKWQSVVEDGRLFHNDYQFITDGAIEENQSRYLCARVNSFEATVMRAPVTFAMTAVVTSPVGTGLEAPVPSVFAFPPTSDYARGLRPIGGVEKPGLLLLVTKQVEYGRSGRLALPYVLGQEEISQDSGGRYRLKSNSFYEQFREEFAYLIVRAPGQIGVDLVMGGGAGGAGGAAGVRRVIGLNPTSVINLSAMRRSGYFNAFPQGEAFVTAAVIAVTKLREKIAVMRYEAGLDHDFHEPKLKEAAQVSIGFVEGLFANLKSFFDNPMGGDSGDAAPVVTFRSSAPSAQFLCVKLANRVKEDARAAYERIAAMPDREFMGERYMLNNDVKLLGELMEPFANQASAILFGDWSNPYLLHPNPEGAGGEAERQLFDKYYQEAQKFPNKPPRFPASLSPVAARWQNWHDALALLPNVGGGDGERAKRFSRRTLHNWPEIGATHWTDKEKPA